MKPDLLIVATHKNWIADELAQTKIIEVRHNFGLSAPLYPPEKSVAWWMPTETASRFARAGVPLNLATIDVEWLSRVPEDLTLRDIWVGTIAEARRMNWTHPAYCKPAEVKIPDAPAQWIEVDCFLDSLRALGVPDEMQIQLSSTLLAVAYEYRCFVNRGIVTTVATYLNHDTIFGGDLFQRDYFGEELAKQFAADIVAVMGKDQPSAYTLDIGRLTNGSFFVMEANPVWASNPYDCDKVEVVKAVIEGSTTYGGQQTHGRFQWAPEAYLTQYAQSKAILPLDRYDERGIQVS
jgi:hypothetical protein